MSIENKAASAGPIPGGEYMCQAQLEYFKGLLLAMRESVQEQLNKCRQDLSEPDTQPDELDRAVAEAERSLTLRRIERAQQSLADVKEALQRIEDQEYGWCEDTGVEIGLKRLQVAPTAKYSVDASEVKEVRDRHFLRAS
ncbi:TraR/DksA family transcriptional regulator [Stutzerimonas stutzeri]|uniref:TraR/DksA family transcriptional regulator n=1 Tax=Stutzerimonas stutzeri TaxID=316 RepID=UPI001BCF0533|nr:TraR/DksA C4-type zinc finger protein [Stutzerimonas stutzeri]